MNIFAQPHIATNYDAYYQTDSGKMVDAIEKGIISGLLAHTKGKKMLELGCGTGHWTSFFIENKFDVTAVDNSEAMLEIARKKAIDARFLLADAAKLPFENNSFDTVASITMLEFVDEQQKVMHEMYRVLKKGGYAIVGCLNAKSEIGKNAAQDATFKHARFLDLDNLDTIFEPLHILQTKRGVFLDTDFTVLDYACMLGAVEPAFIGILLKKSPNSKVK